MQHYKEIENIHESNDESDVVCPAILTRLEEVAI